MYFLQETKLSDRHKIKKLQYSGNVTLFILINEIFDICLLYFYVFLASYYSDGI